MSTDRFPFETDSKTDLEHNNLVVNPLNLMDISKNAPSLLAMENAESSRRRELVGDGASIAIGLLTRWGISRVAPKLLVKAGVVGKVASVALQLGAAGEASSLVQNGRLTLNPLDPAFLRGAGLYGLVLGTENAMRWHANRSTLSAPVIDSLSTRWGVDRSKLGTSIHSVQDALLQHQNSLSTEVRAEIQAAYNAGYFLGPVNDCPKGLRAFVDPPKVSELNRLSAFVDRQLPNQLLWNELQLFNPRNAFSFQSADGLMKAVNTGNVTLSQAAARASWNRCFYAIVPLSALGSRELLNAGIAKIRRDDIP